MWISPSRLAICDVAPRSLHRAIQCARPGDCMRRRIKSVSLVICIQITALSRTAYHDRIRVACPRGAWPAAILCIPSGGAGYTGVAQAPSFALLRRVCSQRRFDVSTRMRPLGANLGRMGSNSEYDRPTARAEAREARESTRLPS